jgi:hypothetical protein
VRFFAVGQGQGKGLDYSQLVHRSQHRREHVTNEPDRSSLMSQDGSRVSERGLVVSDLFSS